jgi:YVTN family beta-propeller protein
LHFLRFTQILAAVLAGAGLCLTQTEQQPVRAVTDPGVVTTRQAITPAGIPTVLQGRVYGVAFGASPSELWVLGATHVYKLDPRANRVLEATTHGSRPGLQGIRFDSQRRGVLVSVLAGTKGDSPVQLIGVEEGKKTVVADGLGSFLAGALAVARQPNSRGQRLAVVPLIHDDRLAVIDLQTNQIVAKVPTGIAPFGAAVNSDGTVAFVANWGGRIASARDLTAPTGTAADADRVVVDSRGIAKTGTVTRIDLTTLRATATIAVGLHPTGIMWDQLHQRLYVANGNQDSVTIIDTEHNRPLQTIAIQPFQQHVTGIAPTAVQVSPDGRSLYVACGGINAVAVVDLASNRLTGLIPTGWYPNSLDFSPDGKQLAVGSLLGAGSGWRDEPRKRFVHSYRGMVSLVDLPDPTQLASYSTAVAENNRLPLAGSPVDYRRAATSTNVASPAKTALPARAGDPSLIEHVVYIIKENRTYDQVFGDLPQGNGDPSLVMFGRDVTPNQHRLADEFVLLDNFFATGGNSADGHQWLTQSNETDYCLWPGYAGRSYPFDGTDPIAYSQGGFLWDLALARKKSVRVYGEFAPRFNKSSVKERKNYLERWRKGDDFSHEWHTAAAIAPLNNILAPQYPSYSLAIPDVIRAQLFNKDLQGWESEGKMPNLTLIQLPSNHTSGTTPGTSSPKAMAADNDLAVGQIVEALTKSQFWPRMTIFIVEDDAQNGVDHVDGHRTVALAVSPYIRRGSVDSTFYSHQSILKSIELILGLPTLSLFDLIANDMRASFTDHADLTGYRAVEPKQSLFEQNPPLSALHGSARTAARASLRMRFDIPDAAPTERLNRILWHNARGWETPYPKPKRSVFAPLAVDVDDDDR